MPLAVAITLPFYTSLFILMSCGPPPLSNLNEQHVLSSKILVVLSAGNATCEPTISGEYSPLASEFYKAYERTKLNIQTLFPFADIQEVMSCYLADGGLWYRSLDFQLRKANEQQMLSYIQNLSSNFNHVFFVGHSYGGWLSMHLGLDIQSEIEGIATIDPISKQLCTYTNPWGCQDFPQDFSVEQRNHIRSKTNTWNNFYQEQSWYLHSAAIPEAHSNFKIPLSHSQIGRDENVWNSFHDMLRDAM